MTPGMKLGPSPVSALRHCPGHPEPEKCGSEAAFALLRRTIPADAGKEKDDETEGNQVQV